MTKHLTMLYPVARSWRPGMAVNLVLVTLVLWPRNAVGHLACHACWLVALRGICLALASLTMGLALQVMPVGETVAIIYLAPFVVLLLSAPVLAKGSGWPMAGRDSGVLRVLLILRPVAGLTHGASRWRSSTWALPPPITC